VIGPHQARRRERVASENETGQQAGQEYHQ
jgi:hypothetical protein